MRAFATHEHEHVLPRSVNVVSDVVRGLEPVFAFDCITRDGLSRHPCVDVSRHVRLPIMREGELSRVPHDGTGVSRVPSILSTIEDHVCDALLMLNGFRSRFEVHSEGDTGKGAQK